MAVALAVLLFAASELARYAAGRALGVAQPRRLPVRLAGTRWRRTVALLAGSLALYLAIVGAAFAIYRSDGIAAGEPVLVVELTKAGFDADGKLAVGDRILAIDGTPLAHRSLQAEVNARHGATVTLTIQRGATLRDIAIQPKLADARWLLGIVPSLERERVYDSLASAALALDYPREVVHRFVDELSPHDAAEPGGPVRIIDEYQPPANWTVFVWRVLAYTSVLLALSLILDLVRGIAAMRRRA
jgi:membrane-associated protease RseP (regulator of RpoE activity)